MYRYILDSLGYIQEFTDDHTIECDGNTCTEYTGTIPSGYTSLEEWAQTANIRAYKIVSGNLTYDSARDTELQNEWNNSVITTGGSPVKAGYTIDNKDVYVIYRNLGTLPTAGGSIYYNIGITLDNALPIFSQVLGVASWGTKIYPNNDCATGLRSGGYLVESINNANLSQFTGYMIMHFIYK